MDNLNLQVIRSSSAGNCTAVWNSRGCILIDAGIPLWVLTDFFKGDISRIDAAIVTHAHADHLSNPCCNLFQKNNIPIVLGNAAMASYYKRILPSFSRRSGCVKLFNAKPFAVNGFDIVPFELNHDSEGGCFGFNIFCGNRKITYATDFVDAPDSLTEHFLDSDIIVIESNHDPVMLENSGRPYLVKKRIREKAHLSNEKCAAFLKGVLKKSRKKPSGLFFAHISAECNSRELVRKLHEDALLCEEVRGVKIFITYHTRVSERVTL